MSVLAIIPAAGMGLRMGGGTPKQFLSLDGVPIFVHTLRKFSGSSVIDMIYLGVRSEEKERVGPALANERLAKPVRVVDGGATRHETVAKALEAAPADTEVVLVHDAVRPFVGLEMIGRVVEAARRDGAAILGIPSVDTVKQVEQQTILGTLPRERIVLAQTPQAFRYPILREAFTRAKTEDFVGTDESSLVERLGLNVTVLMGSDRNIKITKPSDLALARLYLVQETELLGTAQQGTR